ncbi:MAG: hypothetical protein FWD38_06680 [Oscillospiraceae bacterium]|nr:hypothetical protein [Oscillospiraceae bacterium]
MFKRVIPFILAAFLLLSYGCTENPEPDETPGSGPVRTPSPTPVYIPEEECSHFWKNPDCFTPYVCIDCGEEKDFPLEHVWLPANFQEGPICELCGEIGGDPIEPNFTKHGYKINTTSGRPYDYLTITGHNSDLSTTGTATLLYIDIFESDGEYPAKDGYEYIVARIMITFDDENSRIHGFTYITGQLDYFGFDPNERSVAHNELRDSDTPGFKIANRELNYFGENYEYYIKHTQFQNEWVGDISYVVLEYAFLVPVGFDGMVVYISSAANWSDSGTRVLSDNFDDDTLFFRLRTQSS